MFNFNADNLLELTSISDADNDLFLALVCVRAKEIAGATLAELEMNKAALRLPTYPRYDMLLKLDPTLAEELAVMQAEFDFRYATGETSDYDRFRECWLAAGGQQGLDEAEALFRNFGLIK